MTIQDGICDSCHNPSDVLFPVAILDEVPTGGMKHVQKWYCIECKDEIEQEAEENKDKGEDGEDSPIDPINSGRCSGHNALPKRIFNLFDYTGVNW